MKWLNDLKLLGNKIHLLPMEHFHAKGLVAAASDGELWNLWFTSVPKAENIESYINFALEEKSFQRSLPFVVYDSVTNQLIGSTRYCSASSADRRLEIGFTWYAQRYQKTGVNTECKYLLLSHAFDTLNCNAVEFRTHHLNENSQKAIERIGAKKDGVLRKHMIDGRGEFRHTFVYSITSEEWPAIKKRLEERMRS